MEWTGCDLLTVKQVRRDLANLADYRRFARSPLTWYSILCPLCELDIASWRRLGEEGRWQALQAGLEKLLACKVMTERDPRRAAAYGYVWVRYFWARSAADAGVILSQEATIAEALAELLRGEKNHRQRW